MIANNVVRNNALKNSQILSILNYTAKIQRPFYMAQNILQERTETCIAESLIAKKIIAIFNYGLLNNIH